MRVMSEEYYRLREEMFRKLGRLDISEILDEAERKVLEIEERGSKVVEGRVVKGGRCER